MPNYKSKLQDFKNTRDLCTGESNALARKILTEIIQQIAESESLARDYKNILDIQLRDKENLQAQLNAVDDKYYKCHLKIEDLINDLNQTSVRIDFL